MAKKLLLPDEARAYLARRYANQHQSWLAGDGSWPLTLALGVPTERDVLENSAAVRRWVAAWSAWPGPGEVVWTPRQWARVGEQRLPAILSLASPAEAAKTAQESTRWGRASERWTRLTARWPQLGGNGLTRYFPVFADYSDDDFDLLVALITWLEVNPTANVYLRQLPVEGLDTKWLGQRMGLVTDLLRVLRGACNNEDLYALCGLRRPLHRVRLRVLCPALRATVGGLRDVETPLQELASLPLRPRSAIIVENLETGLALPDIPGCVGLMKLGNAVGVLSNVAWLSDVNGVYWGDIDTYGFAILERARRALPSLSSVLMDEETLLAHRHLWGTEAAQHPDVELPLLTKSERQVYSGLRQDIWGTRVRLEQERLPWGASLSAVVSALS